MTNTCSISKHTRKNNGMDNSTANVEVSVGCNFQTSWSVHGLVLSVASCQNQGDGCEHVQYSTSHSDSPITTNCRMNAVYDCTVALLSRSRWQHIEQLHIKPSVYLRLNSKFPLTTMFQSKRSRSAMLIALVEPTKLQSSSTDARLE